MGNTLEKLQRELAAARQALAEAEARCARHDAEHRAVTQKFEDAGRKIEQAHQEWIAALDVLKDPVFLHDKDCRILRCNRAYQQLAGIPFKQIIGQPYYEIFPKTHAPLDHCQQTMTENAENGEDEITVDETTYFSRSFSINDAQGNYLYSLHILEDITERKLAKDRLQESKDLLRSIVENAPVRIFWKDHDLRYLGCNTPFANDAGYSDPDELAGKTDFDMAWKDRAELYRADDKAVMDSGNAKLNFEELQTRDDGTNVWIRTSKVPLRDAGNRIIGMLGIYQDITEHKQTAGRLRESEEQYRLLVSTMEEGVILQDENAAVITFNKSAERVLGLSADQLRDKTSYDPGWRSIHEDGSPFTGETHPVVKVLKTGIPQSDVIMGIHKPNGELTWISINAQPIFKEGKATPYRVVATMHDITERRHAEQTLREEKAFSDTLIKNLPDIFFVLDQQGNFLRWSDNTANLLGFSQEDMTRSNALAFIYEEDRAYITRKLQEAFETGSATTEGRVIALRGIRYYTFTATRIKSSLGTSVLGIGIDITERKLAEEQLSIFRSLLDNSSDAIEVLDPATMRFLDVNETECRELGYTREELLAMRIFDIDSQLDEQAGAVIANRIKQTGSAQFESMHQRKDGSTFPVEINTKAITLDKPYLLSIVRDITERKQHESEMGKVNRALSLLSQCNTLLVHASDEQKILADICKLTVETGGYLMAWVGYAEHDEARAVRPVALSGYEEGYLDNVHVTWADTELGRGPTGTAIRTAQTVINQDVQTNPNLAPWREAAIKRGYQASIALPLLDSGQAFGALTIYAVDPGAFNEEEVALLEELANDLAFGIITLRTRKEHEQHAVILRQSLEQSIQTIADTVEARDPYTAGHQRRVAVLAKAIAQEMGLPEEQVSGLHLAAIIHDLGKIHIPAEILSKPGKLSRIEFELIKTHPQEGYNILKDVKFPWPIADIILQHHERMDGSGYPQGLKGEQILLEARIMAVADVVESMMSHRPYRPGLGIEAALEEIEQNRDVRYDPKVVDACLTLFRERNYQLPG